jgi:hypothetical protein
MTEIIFWAMTETGHDPSYYFKQYSLLRILELGILKISFRGVIPPTLKNGRGHLPVLYAESALIK